MGDVGKELHLQQIHVMKFLYFKFLQFQFSFYAGFVQCESSEGVKQKDCQQEISNVSPACLPVRRVEQTICGEEHDIVPKPVIVATGFI